MRHKNYYDATQSSYVASSENKKVLMSHHMETKSSYVASYQEKSSYVASSRPLSNKSIALLRLLVPHLVRGASSSSPGRVCCTTLVTRALAHAQLSAAAEGAHAPSAHPCSAPDGRATNSAASHRSSGLWSSVPHFSRCSLYQRAVPGSPARSCARMPFRRRARPSMLVSVLSPGSSSGNAPFCCSCYCRY